MSVKWHEKTCPFCGEGSKVYISICIDMPDPEAPPEYNYTEMNMCNMCWLGMGIKPAFTHNREVRDFAGVEHEARR